MILDPRLRQICPLREWDNSQDRAIRKPLLIPHQDILVGRKVAVLVCISSQ